MNICIGGCWHGNQPLKKQKSTYFIAKDKTSGKITLYERFFIWFVGEKHTFWVADSLGHLEAQEKIMFYLNQIE